MRQTTVDTGLSRGAHTNAAKKGGRFERLSFISPFNANAKSGLAYGKGSNLKNLQHISHVFYTLRTLE